MLFYTKSFEKSYYLGCSLGGRQGIKAAMMFPRDFDGIVAGSPALDFNNLASWRASFFPITGPIGSPDFIAASTWTTLIHNEVLNQCDGLDGVMDGIIEDPNLCHFRPETLQCATDTLTNCLTSAQVEKVRKIFSPLYGEDGKLIYPAMQPGSEIMAVQKLYAGRPFSYSEVTHRAQPIPLLSSHATPTRTGSGTSSTATQPGTPPPSPCTTPPSPTPSTRPTSAPGPRTSPPTAPPAANSSPTTAGKTTKSPASTPSASTNTCRTACKPPRATSTPFSASSASLACSTATPGPGPGCLGKAGARRRRGCRSRPRRMCWRRWWLGWRMGLRRRRWRGRSSWTIVWGWGWGFDGGIAGLLIDVLCGEGEEVGKRC